MKSWCPKVLIIGFVLLLAIPAAAQDALYDPDPPPGSAFVRVINGLAGPTGAKLGERDFGTVEAHSATAYRVVKEGARDFVGGGSKATLTADAGCFYSVVVTSKGASLLMDGALESRSKALVNFYNLAGPDAFDLRTADGSVTVIAGVEPGQGAHQPVNGIKVDLAAWSGTTASPPVPGIQLERGNAYSFLLFRAGDALKSVWIQNTTSTR